MPVRSQLPRRVPLRQPHRADSDGEKIYRQVAADEPGIWTLDLDRGVSPYLPICDPLVDGLIVKRDHTHLTTTFAVTLVGRFERFLDENDVLR